MNGLLTKGAGELGLELPETAAPAFQRYCVFLEEKSREMNLTAIHGEKDIYTLHFLDCLAVAAGRDLAGKTAIDIGSGAGFPGVPLKIACPDMRLTLLDAQQKRVGFLSELCEELELKEVQCLHARAEEAAFLKNMRDGFDFAFSRAVAKLNVLSELCLPFVRPGGCFVAMKSTESDEEIAEAQGAFRVLSGELDEIRDYIVPGTDVVHRLVVVRKTGETPCGFPRRFSKISRSPLKEE